MIDLLFVALLQAAAGDPVAPANDPATTQEETASTTAEETSEEPRRPRIMCRSPSPTGSRLGSRVQSCVRSEEEEERISRDRREMEDMTGRAWTNNSGAAGPR